MLSMTRLLQRTSVRLRRAISLPGIAPSSRLLRSKTVKGKSKNANPTTSLSTLAFVCVLHVSARSTENNWNCRDRQHCIAKQISTRYPAHLVHDRVSFRPARQRRSSIADRGDAHAGRDPATLLRSDSQRNVSDGDLIRLASRQRDDGLHGHY